MAILIRKDNHLSQVKSAPGWKLSIDEILEIINGNRDSLYIKDCFTFLVFADKSQKTSGNIIASAIIGEAIYSDCLIVSGAQLERDERLNSFLTPINSMVSGDEFDDMIIKSLEKSCEDFMRKQNGIKSVDTTATIRQEDAMGSNKSTPKPSDYTPVPDESSKGYKDLISMLEGLASTKQKAVVYLDLEKVYEAYQKCKEAAFDDDDDVNKTKSREKLVKIGEQEMKDIMDNAFVGFLKSNGKEIDKDNYCLFEDSQTRVMLAPDKAVETVNIMLWYFIEQENYEACAVLRDVKFAQKSADK